MSDKSDRDNYANQGNPNSDANWESRGMDERHHEVLEERLDFREDFLARFLGPREWAEFLIRSKATTRITKTLT